MTPDLRPLVAADAEAVLDIQRAAFGDLDERFGRPPHPGPTDRAPGLRRIVHLAETDPAGAWVALGPDGRIDGAALALVREGLWGLSLLVVRPGVQSAGLGSALLEATLAYANGARGGVIISSEDPRALRLYARAGFAMRPVMDASGPMRRRPRRPDTVRPIDWPRDRPLVDAASRHVRGATHALDLPNFLLAGNEVLVHERGGWSAHGEGNLRILAATDEAAGVDLLHGVLAGVPEGAEAAVSMIDAANDWAFGIVLEAGLSLRPSGATLLRGEVGPWTPYLPSGAYL
jgi:GNAT superfamily N-acetyltransferase